MFNKRTYSVSKKYKNEVRDKTKNQFYHGKVK